MIQECVMNKKIISAVCLLAFIFAAGSCAKGKEAIKQPEYVKTAAAAAGTGTGFFIDEEGWRKILPMVGIRGGYHLPLSTHFYIEPCGRLGYPFAFGIALMAGISF